MKGIPTPSSDTGYVVNDRNPRDTTSVRRVDVPFLLALGCALYYAVWLTRLCVERHDLFQSGASDLGIFHQFAWLISRGMTPYSTVGQWHMLGDHWTAIVYLLSPVLWINPDPSSLLFLQAIAFAVTAMALFHYARWKWGNSWNSLGLAVAFMLYAPACWVALDDFHPEVFAIPFVVLAAYALDRNRTRTYWCWIGLALLCKETISIVLTFWAVGQLLQRRWRTGVATMLVGLLAFWITARLVPSLFGEPRSHQLVYYLIYGKTLGEVARYFLLHPMAVVHRFLDRQSLYYMAQLVFPLAFLPLLSPQALLPAVPTLSLNLLSNWTATRVITYHYSALIIPFLWIAVLHGLAPFQRREQPTDRHRLFRRLQPATVGVLLLLIANNLGLVKGLAEGWRRPYLKTVDPEKIRLFQKVLHEIPPSASVSASFHLVPHLSSRREIYWYPAPFRKLNWTNQNLLWPLEELTADQFQRRVESAPVDYVLLDQADVVAPYLDQPSHAADLKFLLRSKRYVTLFRKNGVLLLRRVDSHE